MTEKEINKLKEMILNTNNAFSWAYKLYENLIRILFKDYKMEELEEINERAYSEVDMLLKHYLKYGKLDSYNLDILLEDIQRKGKWFKK